MTHPKDTDKLKTARERFKLANEADSKQAQRERDDIAFEDGDQWPSDIRSARQGQQAGNGMPAVPARPTLVINKIREPVRQVLNQERSSDIGIELIPADDFGDLGITPDDTETTLREGLIRRIQRESKAADARSWAFKRAVIAGRGYYLVMTRFLPGKTWDQEVYIHRIYNQSGVLLDPSHEQPDGSDADWGFIGMWCPWDRYKAEYGTLADGKDNPFAESSESDFVAMMEAYPDWYQATGDHRAVRVVDYWHTERERKTLAVLPDGSTAWANELPDGVEAADTRVVVQKSIKFCKIGGGVQELEETDWTGEDMPIIKVLGEEILPYDEQRRAEGMVRPARDAAMGENYMISKLVEDVGLTPINSLIVDPDAIDGYEPWYAMANTRALPYRPSRTWDDQGRQLKEPHYPAADSRVLLLAQSIAMFDGFIQNTTAGAAPDRLGVGQRVQADRAIRRLQEEEQFNTSNFLDNLARSARYEAQVINGLLYPIYGAKPGRMVRIMTGEGDAQTMQIVDPEQQQQQAQQQQRAAKVGKLTKDAHFNVAVKITKSFATRREQVVGMLGEIVATDPSQMMVVGDILYKNIDIPEHKELAERMRTMLAPPIQAMLAAKEEGREYDPQAQAEIAQLKQQVQLAEQAMQELSKDAEGKQLDSQTKIEVEKMGSQRDIVLEQLKGETERAKAELELTIAREKNAKDMYIADLDAKVKGYLQAQEAEHEAFALNQAQTHEAEQAGLDREGQERQQAEQLAHDEALTESGQQHEAEMGERGHEQALEVQANEPQPEASA